MEDKIQKHIEIFINDPSIRDNPDFEDCTIEYISTCPELYHNIFKKMLDKTKKRLYVYMLTFTMTDIKYDESADQYIRDIVKRKDVLQIVKLEYVRELTKKGMPHYHVLCVTQKPLSKDRFNYYITKYGNIDVSKNKLGIDTEITNYLSKVNIPIKLI